MKLYELYTKTLIKFKNFLTIFYKIDDDEIIHEYFPKTIMQCVETILDYPEFFIETKLKKETLKEMFKRWTYVESEERRIERNILRAELEVFGLFGNKKDNELYDKTKFKHTKEYNQTKFLLV